MAVSMTANEALRRASNLFRDGGLATPELDAEVLLAHQIGLDRARLFLQRDRPLSKEERSRFEESLKERLAGCPVAYLTGRKEFMSLPFGVDSRVLIPRPETEHLVEEALSRVDRRIGADPIAVLDLGTGSGAIAVSIAYYVPQAHVVAMDLSRGALEVARLNAARNGVPHRVHAVRADWLTALSSDPPRFDLILSNPPYVSDSEMADLDREVRDYEPHLALRSGADALTFHREIAAGARGCLKKGGHLLIEIGGRRRLPRSDLLSVLEGYVQRELVEDYGGRPRVLIGGNP